ncbi:inositol monophosphatase family protein [Methyloraptor flagellatus]|uniref:Inositol monophosphatase n=1 Tax=Methyloraptor flagellatus TaxID=3162530 RepID=A0AAU7XDD8_9HYPH
MSATVLSSGTAAGCAADLDARFAFAVDVARRAGRLALDLRDTLGPAEAKSAIDFCTEADRAVERLIRAEVADRFGDTMIGEEDGGEASSRVWVVDPIDGTAGYIHGTPRWCVSIALVVDGAIAFGVLYAPAEDRFFTARAGGGAFLNGAPIRVSGLRHGAAPVVEMGWSERRPLERYCAVLQGLTAAGIEFRRHGSGALGLADVACGRNDGYAELHINAWDALAGILLVREAGGFVNDFLADDGLTRGNLLLASTPEIAARLSALVGAG